MRDSDKLRDRATQLLALARKAREDGELVAGELTRLAVESQAEARRDGRTRAAPFNNSQSREGSKPGSLISSGCNPQGW